MRYLGRQRVRAQMFDKIAVRYNDGYTAEFYLDTATHLIALVREHKPMHLAVDPAKQTIETQFSDYRPVSGVMIPFAAREINWKTGEELAHSTVTAAIINSPEALAICKRPATPGR